MFKIMRKDFLLHKKFVLGFGVGYVIYIAVFGSRLESFKAASIFGALLYAMIPFVVYSREDKFKANGFSLSLPVTRKNLILSRYLLAWVLMVVLYFSSAVLMILIPGTKLTAAVVFQPKALLTVLGFMAVFFAVLMPFLTRFGFVGLMVFLVGLQVLGVVVMLLRELITDLRSAIGAIGKVLGTGQAALGQAGTLLVALALLLLINYVSFEISVWLFKRKEF